ncbi:MAG: GDP-mannose 4,6-dehydratase, partial [Chloroflexi bacterium]|nr:GDP-mannose 4,6-dehydratase [Chloroflexota bacterium]
MKKRILITGVSGFVGSHLLDLLAEKGAEYELHGIVRERSSLERIKDNLKTINLLDCDLLNLGAIQRVVKEVEPDGIYHLAGESSVKLSWGGTLSMINGNIIATLNLLEAIRTANCQETRIILVCSSEEYGVISEKDIPIREDAPLRPVSPYAVSKAAVDMFGYQYYVSYGIKVIRIRAFNHTGPRRAEAYALSNFAKQLAEIEMGIREPRVHVGNLSAVRDYTDVRDMVKGYELAMEHCKPGEVYNICSARGYRIMDLLEMLVRMSKCQVEIVQDEHRMRPVDLPIIVGDNTKFTRATT